MSNGSGRIAVVAGAFLDRAWTDLGPAAGRDRREQALPALLAAVREAREQAADGLLVLGGLASRTTVMPATLQAAWRALEAFGGPTLVVPGSEDWWDDQSPYALLPPPPNVTVATSRDEVWDATGVTIGVSAVTTPGGVATFPRSAADDAEIVAVPTWVDGVDSAELSATTILVATDGSTDDESFLVPVPGLCAGGDGIMLMVDAASGRIERRPVTHVDVHSAEIDVTDCAETSTLQHHIDQRTAAGFRGRLRLVGTLGAGVQLPDTTEFEGWLDLDALDYALDDPDPRDQSARAEFVRGLVADTEQPPHIRHQAIAHGLAAFAAKDH